MARRCFFSFHYNRDVWRAQQVKNSWVTQVDRDSTGFFDASAFEASKRQGDANLKRFLTKEIRGSSVLCVLIGGETVDRRWVRYELVKAFEQGKGLLGVRIHDLKDNSGCKGSWGYDPLDYLGYELNATTGVVRFKELRNDSWIWYSDLPQMKYADLPFQLSRTNATFSSIAKTYDYAANNGYRNLGTWIEEAAIGVGR